MSNFTFEKAGIKVSIEGVKYIVPLNVATTNNLQRLGEELIKLGESKLSDYEYVMAIDSKIDYLLGDGTAAKIFKGRDNNALERVAVLNFIFEEITKYFTKK